MRQIFTSQRLETVEGVARLLEDAGIAVYISQPRSYRGKRRGQFSYSEPVPASQQPAVWVRKAEDQPRARELLREAGLLATTRSSYSGLPQPATEALPSRFEEGGGNRWTWRVRVGLLLVIAAVAMFIWMRKPKPAEAPSPATVEQPAAAQPADGAKEKAGEDEEIRVRISPPPTP
ncbi:DUF2007 domain-containing protein [Pseudoxanthomonas koreensis]|uniref:DUF2007 domain-containing protein n=1 Tax=Pseudoxanthomonas koreensis TaxID=266061 RepID=UPI001390FE8F|nr:DUF2007 domain-containing protein [Pseudoxanthomonas koreensis]KAF1689819.1 hypothetical protein CSC64_12295 [Pseudoxanthomonas koreensis]